MLTDLLRLRADEMPNSVAVSVAGGDELRYGVWERRSNASARGLLARGIRPGDHVVLVFDTARWTDLAVAWAATAKVSAVAVLIGPSFGVLEANRIARHCRAAGVVCAPGLDTPIQDAWIATSTDIEEDCGGEALETDGSGDTCEILYSTGPMSSPRPVRFSHHDLFTGAPLWLESAGSKAGPVLFHLFPVGSPAAQEALRFPLVTPGAVAVASGELDPVAFFSVVAERRATCVGVTAAHAQRIAQLEIRSFRTDLSSVELVAVDGPLAQHLRDGLRAVFPRSTFALAGQAGTPGLAGGEDAHQRCEAVWPAGLVQEAMLWQEQFAPGCMNLPPLTRLLAGPLDVGALEASLGELARRHQTLRTTFDVVDGQPVQVVGPTGLFRLPVEDLSAIGSDEQADVVASLLTDAVTRPVDLVAGPLFQPRLLRLSNFQHLLVIPLHHSVWDDWSVGVFNRELSALYPAFLAGAAAPLAEPPVQFAEFARAQRDQLAGSLGVKQRAYWRTQMAGAPLVTQLPIADPTLPPGSPQPAAAPLTLVLPPALTSQLRALAREHNATTFMWMLATFIVLVHRHTGQNDLLVASVVANRTRTQLEGLIGCFAKKILLRVRLTEDPAFPDLVAQVRRVLLESFTHQDLPYEEVVNAAVGRQAARHGLTPCVGVMFQGLTPPGTKLTMPGLESSRFASPGANLAKRAHFMAEDGHRRSGEDVTPPWGAGMYLGTFLRLTIRETPSEVACEAWGAFHPPAVEALLSEYRHLLEEIVSRPASRLADLVHPGQGGRSATGGTDEWLDLGGFRIDRSRMEATLRQCSGVSDVAVCVRTSPDDDPRLVAYVVPEATSAPSLAGLRRFLWSRLPGHAWPAVMVLAASLPRLPGGGLDEAALARLDEEGPGDHYASLPGADELTEELRLLAILWEESSGRTVAGDATYWPDFAFLEVLSVARRMGMPITARHVSRNRTLETLAAALASDPMIVRPVAR